MKINSLIILLVLFGSIHSPSITKLIKISSKSSSSKLACEFTRIPLHYQVEPLNQRKIGTKSSQKPVGYYQNISEATSSNYVDHDIISISGNSDFTATAALENWPGDGNKSNPFIINGLNITGLNDVLLQIQNTNVYFQISNCFLTNGYDGISFKNVVNGLISNNTITYNSHRGIFLSESQNNVIFNNLVTQNNWGEGILINSSVNNSL
ncbi:MAG: right-handed parallel beta-helix repeat-containing protein, partial [Candidatus Hodarchaeales archaeon]